MNKQTSFPKAMTLRKPFKGSAEEKEQNLLKKIEIFMKAVNDFNNTKYSKTNRKIEIAPLSKTNQYLFRKVKGLKRAASKIDIGCGFRNGQCASNRLKSQFEEEGDDYEGMIGKVGGCCNQCRDKVGYFTTIYQSDLGVIAKQWDNESGFLGPKGCRLPPAFKSSICTSFRCRHLIMTKTLSEVENAILDAISA